MPLPRPASPRALLADMKAFWRDRPRHQWAAAVAALLIPVGIVAAFYIDANTNTRPKQTIISVDNWPASRNDEQIKADQRRRQDAIDRRAHERQEQFRRVDETLNRLGI